MTTVALADAIAAISEPHLTEGGPGLVIAATQNDTLLYRQAHGLAHIELPLPLTPETIFPIASVTKHMTAVCVLLLAAEGLIDIDAPVGRYIPELPPLSGKPTLRQLMTHTSGLRCHLDVGPMLTDMAAVRRNDFCLHLMTTLTSVNAAPGAWQTYGNSGWNLLSTVIERVCGKRFEEVMTERVFAPFGMASTRFFRGADLLRTGVASLYMPSAALGGAPGSWINTSDIRTENLGEGGIHSTVDDLLVWASALRREDARVPAALWRELKTPAVLADGSQSTYGLGLMLANWRGLEMQGHGGGLIGLTTFLLTVPAHGVDVVVLANQGVPIEAIARDIAAAIIGEDKLEPPAPKPSTADWPGLDGAVFAALDLVIRFADAGGALGFSIQGSPVIPLECDGDALIVRGPTGPFIFAFPDGPGGARMAATYGGETHDCKRVTDVPALDDLAADVAGSYICDDLGSRLVIARAGEALQASWQGRFGIAPLAIAPIASDVASFAGPVGVALPFQARFSRENGRVTGFHLTTMRTRNLWMRRESAPKESNA